jgi:hypothetical protein
VSQHKEQQGFLTIAANSATVNYLELAYLQALNVKATQTHNSYAVIVDEETNKLIEERHKKVFNYIIPVAHAKNPFSLETYAFNFTPFKETVKLESDLLFTRSIDHWWTAFRLKDVCLSTGALNYLSLHSTVRKYRKLFDDNNLPDVYNGLMYFRFSQTAVNFFRTAQQIFEQWPAVRNLLLGCSDEYASTDVAYAIAANIVGPELCTLPAADFINFVHMKPSINGYDETASFQDVYITECDEGMIRINNVNQYHPLHYHDKTFATDTMIEYYERRRTLG